MFLESNRSPTKKYVSNVRAIVSLIIALLLDGFGTPKQMSSCEALLAATQFSTIPSKQQDVCT